MFGSRRGENDDRRSGGPPRPVIAGHPKMEISWRTGRGPESWRASDRGFVDGLQMRAAILFPAELGFEHALGPADPSPWHGPDRRAGSGWLLPAIQASVRRRLPRGGGEHLGGADARRPRSPVDPQRGSRARRCRSSRNATANASATAPARSRSRPATDLAQELDTIGDSELLVQCAEAGAEPFVVVAGDEQAQPRNAAVAATRRSIPFFSESRPR